MFTIPCEKCQNSMTVIGSRAWCPNCQCDEEGNPSIDELISVNQIKNQINDSFRDVKLDSGMTVAEATDELEIDVLEVAYQRSIKDWGKIPQGVLSEKGDALLSFDEHGWKYHIPAYMIWTLDNWRTTGSHTPSYVIFSLTRTAFPDYFDSLSNAQSLAILHFLEHGAKYGLSSGCKKAIEGYWKRFGTESSECLTKRSPKD